MDHSKENVPETKEKEKEKKDDPVEQGKRVSEVEKKLSGKPEQQAEEEEKDDAEKWRNEG